MTDQTVHPVDKLFAAIREESLEECWDKHDLEDAVYYTLCDQVRALVQPLERRAQQYTQLNQELSEKGLVYKNCLGCGHAYNDHPEVVLEAVKGHDCGCPAGSGFAVRTPSRKRTPQEIEAWTTQRLKEILTPRLKEILSGEDPGNPTGWSTGYAAALADLEAFLATRHAKKYNCDKCHDEKVLHDTPTPGIETPCSDCGGTQ